MNLLLHWALGVAAVLITVWLARLVGLKLEWRSMWGVVIFVPVLALANMVVNPILQLLSLPITILTLGLFALVVNALVFWLAGALTAARMSFWGALFGWICYTILTTVLNWIFMTRWE